MSGDVVKKWTRLLSHHSMLETPPQVLQETVLTPYILSLQGLSGQADTTNMRAHLSFYSKRAQQFFGRTLATEGLLDTAFYISNIKDEDAILVVEIVVLELAYGGVLSDTKSLGWTILAPFAERGQLTAPIYKGSPRTLAQLQNPVPRGGLAVAYQVQIYDPLRAAEIFMPRNALIGCQEELPGILGGRLPRNLRDPITALPLKTLYLKDLRITPPQDLETRLLAFGTEWRRDNFKVEDTQRVVITERRALVGAHNSWHYIGGTGPEATAVLRPNSDGSLTCSSTLVLKETVQDPMCILVFELQYILTVPRRATEGSEQLRLCIGWGVYTSTSDGLCRTGLICGPGHSVSGSMLWTPTVEMDIELTCSVSSTDRQTVVVQAEGPRPQTRQVDYAQEAAYQAAQQAAVEKEQEIQRLRRQLEEEKRRAADAYQVVPLTPPVQVRRPAIESEVQTVTELTPSFDASRQQYFSPSYDVTADPYALDRVPTVSAVAQPRDLKSFEVQPSHLPKEVSRADRARLIKAGVRGLLDGSDTVPGQQPRLDVEVNDPLQAAVFAIQFDAIRGVRGKKLPESLNFGLRFYNFSHTKTETCIVKTSLDGNPMAVQKLTGGEVALKYEVEPSDVQVADFAKYLMKRNLTVEVWCAESLIHYGSARVQLLPMMRQGKPSITLTLEYDIMEEQLGHKIGSLILTLVHRGREPSIRDRTQPSQGPVKIGMGVAAQHKTKKAHLKAKAFQMPQQALPSTNEDQRKQSRVFSFKKSKASTTEAWTQERSLQEVKIARENYKPEVIKKVLRDHLSTGQKIPARAGQAFVFQYLLRNPFPSQECFNISIEDPQQELSLVKIPSEWQWWTNQQIFDRPPEWGIITEDLSLLLEPGESCPLLFKFLSFSPEARSLVVYVHHSKGRTIAALELEVVPQAVPLDHTFRFYEAENRQVRVCLPRLYSNAAPDPLPLLRCSMPKAIVRWESQNEVSIQLKVPAAPGVASFMVMAYADPYCMDITACWEVQVHALVGIETSVMMGQPTAIQLVCPGDEARTVKLYSSEADVVKFPAPHDQPFTLLPRASNNIGALVCCDNPQARRVRVHCVDVYQRTLIHAWLVRVEPSAASVAQLFQLQCRVGIPCDKKVMYTNRTQAWSMFHFRSSHPQLLSVREPRLGLEAGASGYILINIASVPAAGLEEVCIFASDAEESIFEVLKFHIDFA
jgi:hypothetical protein